MDIDALSVKFAKRLKALRERENLSQQQLADEITNKYGDLGITIGRDSIINFETAEKHHTKFKKNTGTALKYLWCFADYFNVSVDYLLGNVDYHTTEENKRITCEYTGLTEDVVTQLHSIAADSKKARQLWCLNAFWEKFCEEAYFSEIITTLEKMYTFSFAVHLHWLAEGIVNVECHKHKQNISEEDKQQLVLKKLTNIADYYSADKLLFEMLSFLISSLKKGETPEFSTIPVNPADIFSYTLKCDFADILEELERIGHSTAPSKEERKQLQLELPELYDAIEFLPPIINYSSNKTEGAEDG